NNNPSLFTKLTIEVFDEILQDMLRVLKELRTAASKKEKDTRNQISDIKKSEPVVKDIPGKAPAAIVKEQGKHKKKKRNRNRKSFSAKPMETQVPMVPDVTIQSDANKIIPSLKEEKLTPLAENVMTQALTDSRTEVPVSKQVSRENRTLKRYQITQSKSQLKR